MIDQPTDDEPHDKPLQDSRLPDGGGAGQGSPTSAPPSPATAWAGCLVVALIIAAAGTGVALRTRQLDRRPMHTDEAVNTIQFRDMLAAGYFEYNPAQRHGHGPVLFYITWPFYALSGADDFTATTETMYRLVPVVCSGLLILLLIPLRRAIGGVGTITAAWLLALSPAFMYYGRYFIHEVLFVAFILAIIAAGWSYARRPSVLRALLLGIVLALCQATKETCVIAWAGLAAGLIVAWLWQPRLAKADKKEVDESQQRGGHFARINLLAGTAGFVTVWVTLYTGFFQNASGPLDSIMAYGNYLHRAGGEQGHDHPFGQYFHWITGGDLKVRELGWMWLGDGLAVALCVIGLVAACAWKARGETAEACAESAVRIRFARVIAVYTILVTLAFSLLSYKTPWNALPFLMGIILLAGIGVESVWRTLRHPALRAALIIVIAIAVAHTGYQSYIVTIKGLGSQQRNLYEYHRDNPYVYGHTVRDVLKLTDRVHQIAEVSPNGDQMLILIMAHPDNQWPLPWYLRRYGLNNLGYFAALDPAVLEKYPAAAIVITNADDADAAATLLTDYQPVTYALRHTGPDLAPNPMVSVFIRKDLWEAMLAKTLEP